MSYRIQFAVVGVLGSVALAAASLIGPTAAAAHSSAPAAHQGVKVSLRHTSKGKVLVGPNGHSLYNFSSDTKNHSNCDSSCRDTWHPLKSTLAPRAGTGVKARLLGRTTKHQVTYRGKPLYYFSGDHRAGKVNGEDTFASGGYWYLVNANGRSVV